MVVERNMLAAHEFGIVSPIDEETSLPNYLSHGCDDGMTFRMVTSNAGEQDE